MGGVSIPISIRIKANSKLLDNGCIIWTGAKRQGSGYGQITYNKKNILIHRLVAHLNLEFDLNSDKQIMHSCDNPPCINVEHLKIGTGSKNMLDCYAKGRGQTVNSDKTHCRRDHLLPEANNQGKRICKICSRIRKKKYLERQLRVI